MAKLTILIISLASAIGGILPLFGRAFQFHSSSKPSDWDSALPIGIKNLGSTCYLNSLVQCMFHTKPLREAMMQSHFRPNSPSKSFQEIFQALNERTSPETAIDKLLKSMELNRGEQQDAEEILLRLIAQADDDSVNAQKLTKEVKEKKKRRSGLLPVSLLSQKLAGETEHILRCLHVPYEKNNIQKFHDLSLGVEGMSSFNQALKDFLKPQLLVGENQVSTSNFGKQDAEIAVRVNKLPEVLMVHLRRLIYDVESGSLRKISSFLDFPFSLNMSSFVTRPQADGHECSRSTGCENLNGGEDKPGDNHIKGNDEGLEQRNSSGDDDSTYALSGIVLHMGKGDRGHFVALVRPHPGTKPREWLLLDDEIVNKISPREVRQLAFGLEQKKKKNDKRDAAVRDQSSSHSNCVCSAGEPTDTGGSCSCDDTNDTDEETAQRPSAYLLVYTRAKNL